MPDFSYLAGNAPRAASYTPPDMAAQLYGMIGNLPNDAFQGQQQARTTEQQNLFKNGVPTGPNGQPDISAIVSKLLQTGGAPAASGLIAPLIGAQSDAAIGAAIAGGGGEPQRPQGANYTSNAQGPATLRAGAERIDGGGERVPQGGITRLANADEQVPDSAGTNVPEQTMRRAREELANRMRETPVGSEAEARRLMRQAEIKEANAARFGATPKASEAALKSAQGDRERAKQIMESIGKYNEPTGEQKNVESGATQKAGQIASDTKHYGALHEGLTGSAHIAAQQAQNLDMLQQVANAKAFTPGAGNRLFLDVQRLAAQFGFNTQNAAPMEIFHQVAAKVLADQFSGMRTLAEETGASSSRVFKSMLDIEEKANITKDDTLEGVKAKIDVMKRMGELAMKWGDMADDYKLKHGQLDAGFDKELRGQMAKARIPNVVPGENSGPPSGYVHDGLRFNGGDYKDPKNWSPVRSADKA